MIDFILSRHGVLFLILVFMLLYETIIKGVIKFVFFIINAMEELPPVFEYIGAEFTRQFTNAFITKQNDLLDD